MIPGSNDQYANKFVRTYLSCLHEKAYELIRIIQRSKEGNFMDHSLKKIEWISGITASVLGVIFHFIYGWTNDNPVAGLFFPVNESTWEHLKLIFFPILLVSIWEYFFFRAKYDNFICVKFFSALIGMAITVTAFYTYTGIYGKNSDVMNILIYFFSMAAAYAFSYKMLRRHKLCEASAQGCYMGFMILSLLFIIFTIFPPPIGLFAPPV